MTKNLQIYLSFKKLDYLIIGGGMVYTFIRAKGGQIGDSICEDEFCEYSLKIIELANQSAKIIFPSTHVVFEGIGRKKIFLTENDELITGLSFGGSTKKKKNILWIFLQMFILFLLTLLEQANHNRVKNI